MGFLDSFQFVDAPLNFFPSSRILSRNRDLSAMAGWAQGLTPYLDNKMTFVKYLGESYISDGAKKIPVPLPFAYYNIPESIIYPEIYTGACNLIGGLSPMVTRRTSNGKPLELNDIIEPYNAREPVFFYSYKRLADYINMDNVGQLIRAYPFLGYAGVDRATTTIGSRRESAIATCTPTYSYISDNSDEIKFENVLSKNDFSDWIVVLDFTLYDKLENYPRSPIPHVFPTIFYSAAAAYYIGNWALDDPKKYERKYINDILCAFPFNPLFNSTIRSNYLSPYAFGTQSYNNLFCIVGDTYIGERGSYISTRSNNSFFSLPDSNTPISVYNNYPDMMCVVAWGTGIPRSIGNENTVVLTSATEYIPNAITGIVPQTNSGSGWIENVPLLIFRDTKSFESLCRDFGFIATSKINDALNMPVDFFPDTGNVPNGGTSIGFPTNNVPNIPNFPDNTSDIVPERAPNISALSSAGVYALNVTQSKNFLNWLMTDDFTKNISNLFNDKLSAIGDLKIMPFDIVLHDSSHTLNSDVLTVGNVTGQINNYRVTDGYNTWINGGEYHYTAYYGDFNDFERCSYSLFVPFAGIIELNPSDVVNKTLKLSYAVDLATGNATAIIYSNGVLIKSTNANMGISVPITSTNNNQRQLNNALTALSVTNNVLNGITSSVSSANPMPLINSGVNGIFQVVNNAMTNPLITLHTGGFGNGTALSLSTNAFLIITRQIVAMPTDYKSTIGIPTTYRGKINEFVGSGFVSVTANKIDIACTQSERDMILSALSRGIYL